MKPATVERMKKLLAAPAGEGQWQRLQDRLRERDGQAMENHGTCPRCGATIVGKVTGPETALEDEIERLNAMLAWIDNIDPQLVDAARERFGVPPRGL